MKRLACLLCASLAALTAHAEFDASRVWVNAGFLGAL
jgi:hypothetical protein